MVCGGEVRWGLGSRAWGRGSPTVMMKGNVLIISRMKGTWKTCSQMLPWGPEVFQSQQGAVRGGEGNWELGR